MCSIRFIVTGFFFELSGPIYKVVIFVELSSIEISSGRFLCEHVLMCICGIIRVR